MLSVDEVGKGEFVEKKTKTNQSFQSPILESPHHERPQGLSLCFPPQLGSFWLPDIDRVLYTHHFIGSLKLPFADPQEVLFLFRDQKTEPPFLTSHG